MERLRGQNFDPAWGRRPPTSSFSLFVSNLPPAISKAELEAMFIKAGKVIDSFSPTDRSFGKQRGFGFVRFKSEREALLGLELANDRSWGGRRILVDLARPHPKSPIASAQNPPFCTGILGRPSGNFQPATNTWSLPLGRPPPSFSGTQAPPLGSLQPASNAWSLPPPSLSG
ncbi:hypothetical protein AAC387_Pa01g2233 [Persea americana]